MAISKRCEKRTHQQTILNEWTNYSFAIDSNFELLKQPISVSTGGSECGTPDSTSLVF